MAAGFLRCGKCCRPGRMSGEIASVLQAWGEGDCRQPSYPKPLCGEPGPLGKEPGVEGEGVQRSQLRDTSMDCQQEGSLEASGGLQASSSHLVQVIIRSFSPSGADLLGFLEGCSFLCSPPLPPWLAPRNLYILATPSLNPAQVGTVHQTG